MTGPLAIADSSWEAGQQDDGEFKNHSKLLPLGKCGRWMGQSFRTLSLIHHAANYWYTLLAWMNGWRRGRLGLAWTLLLLRVGLPPSGGMQCAVWGSSCSYRALRRQASGTSLEDPLWWSLQPQPRPGVWTQRAAIWSPASNLAAQLHCLVKRQQVNGIPVSRGCCVRCGHQSPHGGWAEQLWQGGVASALEGGCIIMQTWKLPPLLAAEHSIDSLKRGPIFGVGGKLCF